MLKLIDFIHANFGIGNDTTATILVTIITFVIGFIINELIAAIKKFYQRRNHKQLLKLNLKNLLKGIYKQAIEYEKISNQLTIEHNGSFHFQINSIAATKIFYYLGYRNLYEAIFSGLENIRFINKTHKRTAFNHIWETLEFLTLFHESSFNMNKEFFELNAHINEQRNQSLGNAMKIIEEFRLVLHGTPIPTNLGEYFVAIEDIILNLRNQENHTNPKIIQESFVEPVLQLNRTNVDLIKEYRAILKPVELNAELLESEIRFTNQKNLIETYNYNFESLNKSFLKNYKQIKTAYRALF